jgi:hypothetical protein
MRPIRYLCSQCNSLLKETALPLDNLVTTVVEECPFCGALLDHNLRTDAAIPPASRTSYATPTFRTAYDFTAKLALDIEQLDRLFTLSRGDRLCIVDSGGRYANLLLTRLWIRALIPRRHGGLGSASIVSVDAGNCTGVYQCVKFARQYYMDIRQVLRSIKVSRAFTIHQVAGLIINSLPKAIEQFRPELVTIVDLLDMFADDPQVEPEEGMFLINGVMRALQKIPDDILVVVSMGNSKPTQYDNQVLSGFTKKLVIEPASHGINARVYERQRLVGETRLSTGDLLCASSVV